MVSGDFEIRIVTCGCIIVICINIKNDHARNTCSVITTVITHTATTSRTLPRLQERTFLLGQAFCLGHAPTAARKGGGDMITDTECGTERCKRFRTAQRTGPRRHITAVAGGWWRGIRGHCAPFARGLGISTQKAGRAGVFLPCFAPHLGHPPLAHRARPKQLAAADRAAPTDPLGSPSPPGTCQRLGGAWWRPLGIAPCGVPHGAPPL